VLREWANRVDGLAIAGFTTWVTNYLSTLMAAAELKRLSAPPFVVLGGPQCSDSEVAAELALASGMADAVVIGEGEQSFLELQARIDAASRSLSGPPPAGVKIWRNGGLEFGGRRPLLRLEDLALPYYDEMNLDAYSRRHRQIIFQLSRGCTDRCEFCSEWVFWERFRSATPESAMDQLRELQRRTRFDHIMFSDSLLNADHKRLVAFAEARLASDYRFSWSGFARAQMDKVTAELLFRAGFNHVFIGVESMSDSTLEKMNKRRTVRDNMDAIENCLNAGIEVVAGVVAGFPGDSRDEFLHTMKVLKEYMQRYPGKISVSLEPFVVTPSAPVFRRCKERRLWLIPWTEEILDAAAIFAPLARRCMARVEGPDQTAERSGRYRYARMMTSDSSAHAVAA